MKILIPFENLASENINSTIWIDYMANFYVKYHFMTTNSKLNTMTDEYSLNKS